MFLLRPATRELIHALGQLGRIDGLGDVRVEAGGERGLGVPLRGVARERQRRYLSQVRQLAQARNQLVSVNSWEADVGDDYIKPPRLGNAERLLGRRAGRRREAARTEDDPQHLQSVGGVLDEQDAATPLRARLAAARREVAGAAPRAARLDRGQRDREAAAAP